MGLPLLNSAPKYEVKIPSSGELIRFRPFLVKEQKVLLLAYESQDKKQIIYAMLDCVQNCLVGEANVYKLTTFDVDFLFAQIRAKSVGESVDLLIKCESCNSENEVKVNIEDAHVVVDRKEETIKLTNEISVKMSYPTYARYLETGVVFEAKTSTDLIMEIIISCIDNIMTEEENIDVRNESKEELITFIESMTADQFAKLSKFVEGMPAMTKDISFICSNCQHENNKTLQGIDDFF